MKTVLFFGSPRKNGVTAALTEVFLKYIEGSVEIVYCYEKKISPCVYCGYCRFEKACAINDDMTEIYSMVDAADNIVFAAPIYFYGVPAPMKLMLDRFQVYWSGRKRGDRPSGYIKKSAIMLVGGAPAFERQFIAAEIILTGVLHELSAESVGIVTVPGSDRFGGGGYAHDGIEIPDETKKAIAGTAMRINAIYKNEI